MFVGIWLSQLCSCLAIDFSFKNLAALGISNVKPGTTDE